MFLNLRSPLRDVAEMVADLGQFAEHLDEDHAVDQGTVALAEPVDVGLLVFFGELVDLALIFEGEADGFGIVAAEGGENVFSAGHSGVPTFS